MSANQPTIVHGPSPHQVRVYCEPPTDELVRLVDEHEAAASAHLANHHRAALLGAALGSLQAVEAGVQLTRDGDLDAYDACLIDVAELRDLLSILQSLSS